MQERAEEVFISDACGEVRGGAIGDLLGFESALWKWGERWHKISVINIILSAYDRCLVQDDLSQTDFESCYCVELI